MPKPTKTAPRYEDLPVKLTEKEVAERSQRAAEVVEELEKHETHKKDVSADLKATQTRLQAELARLSMQVRNKTELRPVAIVCLPDYKRGTVTEFRADNDEKLRERAMREDERQTNLLE